MPVVKLSTQKNFSLLLKRFAPFIRRLPSKTIYTKHSNNEIIWDGNIYKFENLIRRHLSVLIIKKGGFLLHASSIAVKNNTSAVIFTGKSSSGKSTIASVFPDDKILSDELIAITHNSKNDWQVHSTPFRGLMKQKRNNTSTTTPKARKIKRIFFLTGKSMPLKITTPSLSEIYRRLLRNVFFLPPTNITSNNLKKSTKHLILNIAQFSRWVQENKKSFFMEFSLKDIETIKNLVLLKSQRV